MEIDRGAVRRAFCDYVTAYDVTDPKIRLKIAHTGRVARLCERIAEAAGADDPALAWLSGMLHDLGRFEQVRRYHTFADVRSVNHAQLGAAMLFEEGLLSRFVSGLTPEQEKLLWVSIENHSAYRLPEALSPVERMYCQILRDADKLDIFRVNCEMTVETIYSVTAEEMRSAAVSEAVKQCFYNRTAVLTALKRTPADFLVGHICLVFELVYPLSRRIAREQGYVEKMLAFSSANPETEQWFQYMRAHLWAEEPEA